MKLLFRNVYKCELSFRRT